MEIGTRYAVRRLACTAILVISIATPVGAQTAAADALPDAPDAELVLTSADSREASAWTAYPPSTSNWASVMEGAAVADDTEPASLLFPASDDPGRKLVEATEFAPALDGKGRYNVQHRYPSDASEGTEQQDFTHPPAAPDPKSATAVMISRPSKPADFNRDIYYRNKLEFSLETGWLPINIPFVFDFLVGSAYTTWPLHYTMVPNIASIRWHVDGIGGPSILRGNTDFTFSGSYTAIPRGAETRYFAFDYGIRQNFVQPRWRIVPYFEARGGIGNINAKGPYGVLYAQGQDMTFTLMMGSGARYNFNPRYSIAAGMTYMHVSNAYLSQPRYEDLGINVYGPIVGFNMRLGAPKRKPGR